MRSLETTEKSNTKPLSTYLLKYFSQTGQNQLYLREHDHSDCMF